MMDVGMKVWAEIVKHVNPDLPILRDRTTWMAGQFKRPSVFIETDLVSDTVHTPRANRIVEDVGLVFHYEMERLSQEDQGEPIPMDLAPFLLFLRQKRFCYASKRFGVMLVMEAPRTRELKDRCEVTFRYSYLLHVPKLMFREDGQPIQKINDFYIESEGGGYAP